MPGLLGKKLEMTRIAKDYKFIPVTLLEIPSLKIVGKKTSGKEGYNSILVGIYDESKKSEDTVELKEGGKGMNASCFSCIKEFEVQEADLEKYNVGDDLTLDILEGVETVTIEGFSKGKGFAGAMKRWNFSGGPGRVGSKFHRALGSIGTRKPRRTHKGKKMHGHLGNEKVTIKKVPLEVVNKELNVIGVRGGVPGGRNSVIKISL